MAYRSFFNNRDVCFINRPTQLYAVSLVSLWPPRASFIGSDNDLINARQRLAKRRKTGRCSVSCFSRSGQQGTSNSPLPIVSPALIWSHRFLWYVFIGCFRGSHCSLRRHAPLHQQVSPAVVVRPLSGRNIAIKGGKRSSWLSTHLTRLRWSEITAREKKKKNSRSKSVWPPSRSTLAEWERSLLGEHVTTGVGWGGVGFGAGWGYGTGLGIERFRVRTPIQTFSLPPPLKTTPSPSLSFASGWWAQYLALKNQKSRTIYRYAHVKEPTSTGGKLSIGTINAACEI